MHRAAGLAPTVQIRYNDHATRAWIWSGAPLAWHDRIDLEFRFVRLGLLEPAGSLIDPAVVTKWLQHLRHGGCIPPPAVCLTERDTFYLHDGNHRYMALKEYLSGNPEAMVRVAMAAPKRGFRFRYRRFSTHGTFLLEPETPLNEASHCALPRAIRCCFNQLCETLQDVWTPVGLSSHETGVAAGQQLGCGNRTGIIRQQSVHAVAEPCWRALAFVRSTPFCPAGAAIPATAEPSMESLAINDDPGRCKWPHAVSS